MRITRRRGFAAASTALITLLIASGCASDTGSAGGAAGSTTGASAAADGEPVSGGELVFDHDTDPSCIDPQQAANWSLDIGRNIADSLLAQVPGSTEFQPWLASAYEANEEGTEFTFTIRDDITFSDGTALTPEVVKANIDGIKALGASSGYLVSAFTSYVESVVEGDEVIVRFSEPNFPFVQAASSPSLGILSEETLAKTPEERCQGAVVATGPFVLDHYTAKSEVLLTKREGYDWAPESAEHSGEAYLDSITFNIVTESSVRDGSLDSGQVDGIRNPSEDFSETFANAPYTTVIGSNPGIASAFDWNYARELIQNKSVRVAVLKGINREEIAAVGFGAKGRPATSVLTSSTIGYSDNSDLLAYDPEGAIELLEADGWVVGADGIREKDGEKLVIRGVLFTAQKAAGELQAQQLKQIGIDLQVTLSDSPSTELKTGNYDFFQHANTAADPDVLRKWFVTSLTTDTRNFTETITNLDELLLEQPSVPNGEQRDAILSEAAQIILENAYSVPINESTNAFAFAENVHGFWVDAQASSRFYDVWKSEQ